jgi:SAM-dependent methyltransferase
MSDRILKRNQIEVLAIAEGFLQSSVLFALLKLRMFEHLDRGTKSLYELATDLGARPETMSRLLNAGVVLKLLESKHGINFGLTPACGTVLAPSAGRHYVGDCIRNLEYFRVALKSGPRMDPTAHLGGNNKTTREFTLAFHNYASLRGKELAEFLSTVGCTSLLDVGCGPGTYSFELGLRNPSLQLYLLDFPEVLEIAKEIQTTYPLKNTVHYLPSDALQNSIPNTYDMILVSNALHAIGEDASRTLIKRLYNSVNQGGSLVIQAQFLQDDRLGGRWPVLLDLLQLCITAKGRNHSQDETRRWLEEAGFRNIQFNPMTLLNTNSFLRGYKT